MTFHDLRQPNLLYQVFLAIGTFIISLFLVLVYKILIRPLVRMQFYRKQGIKTFFIPLLGRHGRQMKNVKLHGDAEYYPKNKSKTDPGRAICGNIGFNATLILHDPALIKELCLNPENYIKDPAFVELYSHFFGQGLLTSEGSQWKTQRKILSNVFHFDFLKSNILTIQKTAHDRLYSLRKGSLKEINILDNFQYITGEVIGKVFFGEQLNQYTLEEKPLTLALADIILQTAHISWSIERFLLGASFIQKGYFPKHRKLMEKAETFRNVCRKIEERKKTCIEGNNNNEQKANDMLSFLLEYAREGGKMSDEDIIDQFTTFFLAGMDTTGHLALIAVYNLHAYPEFKEKVLEEVNKHYKIGKPVDIEDLNKLEFTTAFLKESLRYLTPVPGIAPRRAVKDHKLGDISVRKGDLIEVEFFYNHFNSEYFKDPEKFDPYRWLNKENTFEPYAFVPFSSGPRNCIGQHLALIEARIILAELVSMYEFSLIEGYKFGMEFKFLYEPIAPVLLNLTPKNIEC